MWHLHYSGLPAAHNQRNQMKLTRSNLERLTKSQLTQLATNLGFDLPAMKATRITCKSLAALVMAGVGLRYSESQVQTALARR